MPARLTVHTPHGAAAAHWLDDDRRALRIGRGADCELRIDHPSVSRLHAELHAAGGWRLADAGSKNGTCVDGEPVRSAELGRHAWLRFGDVHCEFAAFGRDELDADRQRREARRQRATALTEGFVRNARGSGVLESAVRAVIELARCERGFLLLRDGDDYAVRARIALDPGSAGRGFSGSVGAVERALRTQRTCVVNEIERDAWLRGRASVVAGGIRALVCLPLLDEAQTLGAIYADRSAPGEPVDALDVELLEAFADRAALYVAARGAADALEPAADAAAGARWRGIVASCAAPR
ncbi:FHA domain-containing protein [Luteimonas sp. Y-2-2-4F]|nr:FHA domain-containing protein [Luteimonas sp. Y-2-2-4F]MCD9032268.1 FHA domain-containing protein [Luteimonas sp. Y-2-2-4F]